MKKIITLIFVSFFTLSLVNGQAFFDDFESYTVGSYLGNSSSNWTTWSSSTGGADDVKIVNNDASSGTKSIYFSSTSAQGGPVDVVLPFDGIYSSGYFTFAAKFKVPATKTAYFNFQANETVGEVWAFECHLNSDESIVITNATGDTLLTDFYPSGTWFEIKMEIDLNLNVWEVFIDNTSIGTFSSSENQIASLNLFPANASAKFWVDDVSYAYSIGASVHDAKENDQWISLYPNPSRNSSFLSINLDKESAVQISVYQINGALVAFKEYDRLSSGQTQLPLGINNPNPGIYFVKVMTENETGIIKLIKE